MKHTQSKIESSEVIWVALLYLFMMINYYLVLVIDTGISFHVWPVTLNHLIKALITLPLWWLFFRYLSGYPMWKKIIIHLLILPVFSFVWISSYYGLCDYLGLFHLKGSRQVWDLYLTALFYIIQFGNFHLYDYYVRHRKQELFAAELGQLALQSELSALKAQLNPHFLYNVFNTINATMPPKAEKSRNMVAKLSDLFRYQLKASKEEFVTLKEELDFVMKYLDLEKERFGERLEYHFDVDEKALQNLIPPILIQPLVENSIKHGISSQINGGEVIISITSRQGQLNVNISDTGVGLQNQTESMVLKKGIGLSNTHERLTKMYGSGLKIMNKESGGLEVGFSIPINR